MLEHISELSAAELAEGIACQNAPSRVTWAEALDDRRSDAIIAEL